MSSLPQLWPDDCEGLDSTAVVVSSEPNRELACILLAAGCSPAVIREQCSFPTTKAVRDFAKDAEVVAAVRGLASERANRIGNRSLVRLERLLAEDNTDLRATVLAVRTGLEVAQLLKGRGVEPPTKQVSELSVAELSELIDATKAELDRRITLQRPHEKLVSASE